MLAPYRVLDLSDERGMNCGQLLADLGADVIAVEPPAGSPARCYAPFAGGVPGVERSLFWQAYARNKRSVVLDLDGEEGRRQLVDLAGTADVLIESFPPGYLATRGLDFAALSTVNPGLVMVSITPFGQSGPKAGWAATDLTVLASSCVLLLTGDADRPPVRVSVPQAFLHAGAEAAVGALVALTARERDGLGQHVDVSAQTATMIATQYWALAHGWGSPSAGRVGGGAKLGPVELRLFRGCRDGFVSITFLFGSAYGTFARRLMEWMCEEGFVDVATRDKDWWNYGGLLATGAETLEDWARANEAIDRFAAAHTKAELLEGAMQRGLLIVPVSTMADLVHSPQLAARGYWTEVGTVAAEGAGSARRPALFPGPFAKLSRSPLTYRRSAPRLGEHTAEVLQETRPPRHRTGASATPAVEKPAPPRLPLDGVKILDFSWVMVAPAAVRYLCDYGATVVHVESTTRLDGGRNIGPYKDGQAGGERSALYANAHAGKLGLTLNLSTPEARGVAKRLAAWADIVVESYTPKAMRNWGLDYASLRELNPSLIMLSSCLNGQDGPQAGLAGFGTMGAALAGFGELAGWPDRPPAGAMGAYTDYVAPKFIAATLLAALDHRRRTGEGQFIDLSQSEAAIHFLTPAVLDYTVNGRLPERAGNLSNEHAPHGVYPAQGDDRWVAITCGSDAQWASLCSVVGPALERDPRFSTFAGRQEERATLDEAIGAWTSSREVEEIESLLQAAGVPVHRVSTSEDASSDPQLAHRGHLVTVEHPELGPVPVETSRMRFSRTPARPPVHAPTFGEHNDLVLREILGLDDEEIAELAVAGALE